MKEQAILSYHNACSLCMYVVLSKCQWEWDW